MLLLKCSSLYGQAVPADRLRSTSLSCLWLPGDAEAASVESKSNHSKQIGACHICLLHFLRRLSKSSKGMDRVPCRENCDILPIQFHLVHQFHNFLIYGSYLLIHLNTQWNEGRTHKLCKRSQARNPCSEIQSSIRYCREEPFIHNRQKPYRRCPLPIPSRHRFRVQPRVGKEKE